MRLLDLSKQQALDAHPNTIQQLNLTGNLDRAAGATMFFIIEEAEETILDFAQHKELLKYCNNFNIKWINITL